MIRGTVDSRNVEIFDKVGVYDIVLDNAPLPVKLLVADRPAGDACGTAPR
jgi:hypothetical protein